jgi:hypothetical protein
MSLRAFASILSILCLAVTNLATAAEQAKLETIDSQPSWILESPQVRLAVTKVGGQMAPVTFLRDSGKPVQPYHISPWQNEGLQDLPAPVLTALRGDWFCIPFGGNGTDFRNGTAKAIQHRLHIHAMTTVPYNPQGNGKVENRNKTIYDLLTAMCKHDPENHRRWDELLPVVACPSHHNATHCPHGLCNSSTLISSWISQKPTQGTRSFVYAWTPSPGGSPSRPTATKTRRQSGAA